MALSYDTIERIAEHLCIAANAYSSLMDECIKNAPVASVEERKTLKQCLEALGTSAKLNAAVTAKFRDMLDRKKK